jgi:protein involved in polysaccharide export with SLBB domain
MMQLTRWPGPKQIGQSSSPRRCGALSGALALILLGVGLGGCEETRSFERASDGSTVYVDQLSEAAKTEAREKIVQSLTRGPGAYGLGVGDEVEIFFDIHRKPTPAQYVITATDKLRIEFLGDTENSRTVQVAPDGRIYLPLIAPVMAAGQTAGALAGQLQERYSHALTGPKVTVNVTESHSALDDFIEVLGSSGKGRSIVGKVLPDGTISVPLLPSVPARGRTLTELQNTIDVAYSAEGLDLSVSVAPRTLRAGETLVIGEVGNPGRIELKRPVTVQMAVAQAGGVLTTGAMDAVRVFYIGDDGVPHVRSINLSEVKDDLRLENDMIVPANSIIFVPPTELAKTGRFMEAFVHNVLRFQGIHVGGSFFLQ